MPFIHSFFIVNFYFFHSSFSFIPLIILLSSLYFIFVSFSFTFLPFTYFFLFSLFFFFFPYYFSCFSSFPRTKAIPPLFAFSFFFLFHSLFPSSMYYSPFNSITAILNTCLYENGAHFLPTSAVTLYKQTHCLLSLFCFTCTNFNITYSSSIFSLMLQVYVPSV